MRTEQKTPGRKMLCILRYICLVIFAVMCIYPLIWLFLAAFKTNEELYVNAWGLPQTWNSENFRSAVVDYQIFRYFLNSILVSFATVAITLVLAAMVSFAITRLRWKLSKLTYNLFTVGMMIPVYAMIIPLFYIFKKINLLNSYWSVIIAQTAIQMPLAVFILTGFMRDIPYELEEAAIIDGCSMFGVFWRIILPISRPSLVTVAVVNFINVWNELLLPRIFLTETTKMTLPVGLSYFSSMHATNYVAEIAAIIITIIPTILMYVLLHKNIMEGMVAGAVKG